MTAQRLRIVLLFVFISLAGALICGCDKNSSDKQTQTNIPKSDADALFDQSANQPPSLKTLYVTSDILISQGRDQKAEVILTKINKEHPQFTPAYNSLAEIKMRSRKIDEAIKILSEGLKINSKDTVLLNNMGMCWMVKRDYNKALDFFTEAAGVNPQNTKYRANMAVALAFLGRDVEAKALYRQILTDKEAELNLETIKTARNAQVH